MKRSSTLDRRRFLQASAVTAAGAPVVACSGAGGQWRFFTDAEAATLGAICDQIVPPDDDPGAVEAGVLNYIDRQLVGHYEHWQEAYRIGIREMDEAAAGKHGKPFVELLGAEQVALLTEREETGFFRMVVDHTMQGFYGDPRHGGNRDAVSWRMIGVPNPPVRGRHHYDFNEG